MSLRFTSLTAMALSLGLAPAMARAQSSNTASVQDPSADKTKVKKHKTKRKKKKRKALKDWALHTEVSLDSQTGVFSGDTTLRRSGSFEETGARVRPELEHRYWRLQVPMAASDRRSVSTPLDETAGSVGARLRYKKTRELALTFRADVSGRWRDDWLDQYQPLASGELNTTDRYSRWQRSAGVDVASVVSKKHHLKAAYQYELFDYKEDPNFDPVDEPTHVVPGDRGVHSLDLSWMRWRDRTKAGGGLDLSREESFFAYARDAKDGRTHAPQGGLPPNPLQVLFEVEPYVAWEYGRLKDPWQLDLYYGANLVSDRFEGYYSSAAHHPKVDFAIKTSSAGKAKVGAEVYWRRYGANSYQAGGSRPPLTYGDRRTDRKFTANVSYEHEVAAHWSVIAEGKAVMRRTNYPDYVPMVYPSSRDYDIRWNYTNVVATVGVEWRVLE